MNILYVEDNSLDSDMLLRFFSSKCELYSFVHVTTKKEAIEHLQKVLEEKIDIVLTDFKLPDGTGLELLDHIRSHMLPVAVVLITGQGDEQAAVNALKLGADDYVPKTFEHLELLPKILNDVYERRQGDLTLQRNKLRVLYAEHLEADIDLTRRHLSTYAPYIEMDIVPDAIKLLSKLRRSPEGYWDVLLMDYKLPGMNALEAIREINHISNHPPIIIVTGQGDEQVAAQALRLGAVDYIVKEPGYLYKIAPSLESAYFRAKLIREHKALMESEERFRVAQDMSPDGFTILHPIRDDKGNIVDFSWIYENAAVGRINNTVPAEVIGKQLLHLFPSHKGTSVLDAYIQVAETGTPKIIEEVYVGEIVSVPTWLRLVIVPMGKDIAILAQNITERKQLEIERQKFFLIAESSSEFIGMCDLEMNPIYVNPKGCRMVGLPDMKAACQIKVQDYFYPEDQEFIRDEFFPKVLQEGQGDVEIRLRHFQTGKPIWVDYYLFAVRDSGGHNIGWATVSHDITLRREEEQVIRDYNKRLEQEVELRTNEIKLAHEQLIQQDRLATLGRLAGGMAHELRNPLGVISNAVYYLRMILPDANDKVKEYLGILEKESQVAVQIMSDLLNYSTFQTGDRYPIRIKEVLDKVLQKYPAPGAIKIDMHVPDQCADVFVDSHQIEMALGRLVLNAYQAMEKGGKLTINVTSPAKKKGGFVTIKLVDTGTGIAQEDLNKVFDPLFTTKPRHIGLGLSISKRLIEVNGGTIALESKWGKGTTVTLGLPLKPEG